ncbi:MAG: TonB-dependent receptor domain-containing protein [Adhaeribacter sp.]
MSKYSTQVSLSFFLLSWLINSNAFGQTIIKGNVQEESGKPFPFANVLLLNAQDSALVKGTLSGETGLYRFENIKPGSYLIASSAVGYKQTYSKFFLIEAGESTYQLNALVLKGSARELQEVSVMAKKPLLEQHLDRLVVNVQNSITAAGGTALDVLERSPGINVNRQQNTIAMSGKTGVVVMVNGKVTRLPMQAVIQMLSGMNAGNIEKIELITTPSARYDAEGNAGMINIITKKNTELGTNGSYSGTLGYSWYEKAAATASLNHRTAKLNLFGDGAIAYDHFMFKVNNNRQFNNQNQLTETSTISKRYTYATDYNGRLGFDYTINAKTTVGALVSGWSNKWDQFCHNYTNVLQDGQAVTKVYTNDHEINHWRHLMGNLNLRHAFKDGQQITVDLDYLFYYHNNPHWYKNDFNYLSENSQVHEQMNNGKITPIQLWVGKVDFTQNIGKNAKLEAGLKATLSGLNNKLAFLRLKEQTWQLDSVFSQHVKMEENIGAAYLNLQQQLNTKTKLQTGLRLESTYTNLITVTDGENLVNRRYTNLFPSVFISHELSKNHDLQLAYSRRITRPTFNDLSPFFTFLDPYTSTTGNTALKPTITNALQVTYQLQKQYLLTLQYSRDNDGIAWISRIDPEKNAQYYNTGNIDQIDTYSLSLNFPVTVTAWWQMQNNVMGSWQQNKTQYQEENIRLRGGNGRLNTTQNITLPKAYSFELVCSYQSRALHGIGYQKPFGFVNLGIQKKLKNNRDTFRLTGSDLFWTQQLTIVSNNPQLNQSQDLTFKFEPRVIRLTYSHNFGNKNLKALNNRSTGSEEERKRVNR